MPPAGEITEREAGCGKTFFRSLLGVVDPSERIATISFYRPRQGAGSFATGRPGLGASGAVALFASQTRIRGEIEHFTPEEVGQVLDNVAH